LFVEGQGYPGFDGRRISPPSTGARLILSSVKTSTRVLIVDKQSAARELLRGLLSTSEEIEIVGEAMESGRAVEAVRTIAPEVVIIAAEPPGFDELEASRAIRETASETAVLLIMDALDYAFLPDAVRAGARGFLLGDISREELIATIKRLAEGKMVFDPRLTEGLGDHVYMLPPPRRAWWRRKGARRA
jgi:DNA-binding NarL/FixJ family response regulator